MAILLSNEIMRSVRDELRSATQSVQIITAYCKENAIRKLDECIHVFDKKIMLRFRLDDIVKGSSDFSVLEYCISKGWKVFIRFDLHAKTYIVDNKRGLVGSANITNSGLGIGSAGNLELATLVDIEQDDIRKIASLYEDAIEVDSELVSIMKKQLDSIDSSMPQTTLKWDDAINNLFHPNVETLFSHELPDEVELFDGEYLAFLDEVYNGDRDILKETFRWSNAYLWLLNVLVKNGGCLYFGEITAKLHDALISDPKPYRKDVKQMLSNLLKLVELLDMEEVVIDRPNYSQRVRITT